MKRKSNMSIIAVLLTVFTAAVVLTGCPNTAGGGKKRGGKLPNFGGNLPNFAGTTWKAEYKGYTVIATFTTANSGTGSCKIFWSEYRASFTCTADTITFSGDFDGSYNYTVSGNTLTVEQVKISRWMPPDDITFTKQ